jgi:hypothetical protein
MMDRGSRSVPSDRRPQPIHAVEPQEADARVAAARGLAPDLVHIDANSCTGRTGADRPRSGLCLLLWDG